jgi:hypothetical protein
LENKPNLFAAKAGQLTFSLVTHIPPEGTQHAPGWPIKTADTVEQGGLTAARTSFQSHELPGVNFKVYSAQGVYLQVRTEFIDPPHILGFDCQNGYSAGWLI